MILIFSSRYLLNSFYFDFTSPYSYLTWERLLQLNFPLKTLEIKPVLVGRIISEVGSVGPAGIASKRNFLFQDCLRKSVKLGIKLVSPGRLPFNPMDMLRFAISLGLIDQRMMHNYITSAFRYGWQNGYDYEDYDHFREYIIQDLKITNEAFESHQNNKESRKLLKEHIVTALSDQVFGVPSFVVKGKVFWGLDSLGDFLIELENKDCLDSVINEYERFINIVENKKMEEL